MNCRVLKDIMGERNAVRFHYSSSETLHIVLYKFDYYYHRYSALVSIDPKGKN